MVRNGFIGTVLIGVMIIMASPVYSEERPTNVISTGVIDLFAAFDGWYSIVEYERAISENNAVALGVFRAKNSSLRASDGAELKLQLDGMESCFRRFSSGAGAWHFYYGAGLNIFDLKAERTTSGSGRKNGSAIGFEPKVVIGGTFRKKTGFVFTFGTELGYLISDLKLDGQPVPGGSNSAVGRPFMNIGWGW